MQEIRCPKCNEVFQVDDSGYSQIVQQVRDKEFEKEAARRAEELEKAKNSELKIIEMEYEKKLESALSEKSDDISDKEKRITELEARLKSIESEKQLAVANAVRERENSFSEESRKAQKAISDKDIEIAELTAKLKQADNERAFAVDKANSENALALAKKDNEINELNSKLQNKDNEAELRCRAIEEKYAVELKNKDELIEQYKDFKARLSTKMVGETLEQHCLTQFNSLRMSAFPNAYFEKDNNAKSGSKGDFIFRESEDGIEFISIMFEMKNEMDTTATKHKNEDFFKELDKDRNEKGCEYAVLVSMLEADNEFYNAGIVDVSYKYPKMYVIRPQFFIPLISLLRNAARNSLEYKRELALAKAQEVDLTNFENNINEFKNAFSKNYQLASKKFNVAIEEIDKTIDHLQKTKDALLSSENNLRLANNKAEEQLSVKKLTKNAPSIREEFENIANRQSLPGAD
ncbi:MAG TPA: DUF2130 domain-containing protein [Ruminococcaceae bacterium]|jgi:hypothetical protein|nr:DUF2130 domain-containing protein [Oscillospiraceae bacterium]